MVDGALHQFGRLRAQNLRLYSGVAEALAVLRDKNVILVGHTEAVFVNAVCRPRKLGIAHYFENLHALDGAMGAHPLGSSTIE